MIKTDLLHYALWIVGTVPSRFECIEDLLQCRGDMGLSVNEASELWATVEELRCMYNQTPMEQAARPKQGMGYSGIPRM